MRSKPPRRSSPSAPASAHYAEGIVRDARGSIRLARGDLAGAKEDKAFLLDQARRIKDPQRFLPTFAAAALTSFVLGDEQEARTLVAETLAIARENVDVMAAANHLNFVAGLGSGAREELHELAERSPRGVWKELMLAGARGDLVRTADLYAEFGSPTLEALARFFAGQELDRRR